MNHPIWNEIAICGDRRANMLKFYELVRVSPNHATAAKETVCHSMVQYLVELSLGTEGVDFDHSQSQLTASGRYIWSDFHKFANKWHKNPSAGRIY